MSHSSTAFPPVEHDISGEPQGLDRRALLVGGGAALAGLLGYTSLKAMWQKKSPVFIADRQRYDIAKLEQTIRDGLLATGLQPERLRGRRVLLKPNMVEPSRDAPHMTTHPSMVLATAEVFRRWGAQVTVGEAPGHVRDTQFALFESGIGDALKSSRLPFADLNYQDVAWVANGGKVSRLSGFHFPQDVVTADLIVSLPKLKTHHWVGFTASMKNLYGTIPGIIYGWPKNVLHYSGIPATVVDINASIPKSISVIDGIECMEGDGPIMGSPKHMGLVVVGTHPTAVDATCARIMGLRPERVPYLELAARKLGPIRDEQIEQRGVPWQPLVSPFGVLDWPHLRPLCTDPGVLISGREPPRCSGAAHCV